MNFGHAVFVVINHGMNYSRGSGFDQLLQVTPKVVAEIRRRCPVGLVVYVVPPHVPALDARENDRVTHAASVIRGHMDRVIHLPAEFAMHPAFNPHAKPHWTATARQQATKWITTQLGVMLWGQAS
jgi:hypothetical protein